MFRRFVYSNTATYNATWLRIASFWKEAVLFLHVYQISNESSGAMDCFTVPFHCSNDSQLSVEAVQGRCQWPLNTVEILAGHLSSSVTANPLFSAGEESSNLYSEQTIIYPATEAMRQTPHTDSTVWNRSGPCDSLGGLGPTFADLDPWSLRTTCTV